MHWLSRTFIAAAVVLSLDACSKESVDEEESSALELGADEQLVSILATNDIHGGLEARTDKEGQPVGGMARFSGVVKALRSALQERFHTRPLLVDAGDQFQGTLLSNFNEGELVFRAMEKIGYDAVVTGNHDYDFGPVGWLEDEVTASSSDRNPRGALERVAAEVRFPILSANTVLKSSLVDASGRRVEVAGVGCTPVDASASIAWEKAARPAFLRAHVVRDVSGVRVALIGLDNPQTPLTTTAANVSDLCFRSEVDAYLETRKALEGQADVFVAIAHDGDTTTQSDASGVVANILERGGASALHAFVAGHTHFVNNANVKGVPVVQSGSGLEMFGRIDLVWNRTRREVVRDKTRAWGGIPILHGKCSAKVVDGFCVERDGEAHYEGHAAPPDADIAAMIAVERDRLAPMAQRKLGSADAPVTRDRAVESALANALTDALFAAANAHGTNKHVDVAFMNTGGIRDNFAAGDIRYEDLFRVLPFNNHGVVVAPMPGDKLLALLKKSVSTCGAFGALMQAGLRVKYARDCARAGTTGVDPEAKLVHVETLGGEVLFDEGTGTTIAAERTLTVATLDFLAEGGSGFDAFKGTPRAADLGIVREVMTDVLLGKPWRLSGTTDGRWTNVAGP